MNDTNPKLRVAKNIKHLMANKKINRKKRKENNDMNGNNDNNDQH